MPKEKSVKIQVPLRPFLMGDRKSTPEVIVVARAMATRRCYLGDRGFSFRELHELVILLGILRKESVNVGLLAVPSG